MPLSLRPRVLENFHSAHLSVTSMTHIFFWHWKVHDIEYSREKCQSFNKNFPFQPSFLQELSYPPTTSFEKIFEKFAGNNFLVVGVYCQVWQKHF